MNYQAMINKLHSFSLLQNQKNKSLTASRLNWHNEENKISNVFIQYIRDAHVTIGNSEDNITFKFKDFLAKIYLDENTVEVYIPTEDDLNADDWQIWE